jgi:hypothetical protein
MKPNFSSSRRNPLAMVIVCILGLEAVSQAQSQMPQKFVFHRVAVKDNCAGMNAVYMLVPDQWQTHALVIWIGPGEGLTTLQARLSDPKTGSNICIYPTHIYAAGFGAAMGRVFGGTPQSMQWWEGHFPNGKFTDGGQECEPVVASPMQFLKQYGVPRYRPDIRELGSNLQIVSTTDYPPDVLQNMASQIQKFQPDAHIKMSKVRVQYPLNGVQMVEDFTVKITAWTAPQGFIDWSAEWTSVRAPVGQMDALAPVADAIVHSINVDYHFWSCVCQVSQEIVEERWKITDEMVADSQARMAAMHEYFQRTIDDNSQRMQENFQRQMANKDWQQQQELNYINDEKEYQDPNGGNIDLPMNYKYHYSDPQGDIYCTNDPDDLPPGAQPLNPTPAP